MGIERAAVPPASGDRGPENGRIYQLNCVDSRSIRPST